MDFNKDFPSLRLGYEHVKDVLQEQAELAHHYVNRAITLFSIATAVIGIGLPLLFTQRMSEHYLIGHVSIVVLSPIPILLYVVVVYYSWKIYQKEFLKTISSPTKVTEDFLELQPEEFYSNMIQHITSAFEENEEIIKGKEQNLTKLIIYVIAEAITMISLVLILFSFGFLG